MTETDFQYRILQNSISRFSIYLNKADSLQDVCNCLLQNVKYLYNYSFCRFHYFHGNKRISYTVNRNDVKMEEDDRTFMYPEENEVFVTAIPYYHKTKLEDNNTSGGIVNETWIWKFTYNEEAGMMVTIDSSGDFRFLKDQIPLVKIAAEMLYTKTRMIFLLDDLHHKQEALLCSYKKLEESNAQISNLLSQQEHIIGDRTQALTRLNAKLVELIQFNSHNIREPLTRVMGLMSLYELMSSENFFTEYWPLLEESVSDMDKTIRQVINKTEKIEKHENLFD